MATPVIYVPSTCPLGHEKDEGQPCGTCAEAWQKLMAVECTCRAIELCDRCSALDIIASSRVGRE